MDKTFNVSVRDRLAKNLSHLDYVCGNTGYIVQFDFDEEWDAYPIKTARFIEANGTHYDKPVIDDRCEFPQIMNTIRVEVGVFAGDLYTTTPAVVSARRSILSSGGDRPAVPEKEPYDQMMEAINADALRAEKAADAAEGFAEEAKEAAENAVNNDFLIVRQTSNTTADKTYDEIIEALNDGKTLFATDLEGTVYAYSRANAIGVEFTTYSSEKYTVLKGFSTLKITISKDNVVTTSFKPVMARNYERLIFKGAVNAVYDGSEAVTVQIPTPGQNEEGGGSADQVQADWNENDPNSKAYVQNRTHYSVVEEVTVLPEGVYAVDPDEGSIGFPEPLSPSLVDGGSYTVVIEGETFNSIAKAATVDGVDIVYIGNPSFIGAGDGNGDPYMMLVFADENIASVLGSYGMFVCTIDMTSATLKVTGNAETVKKIPEKFIPAPKNGAILNGSQPGSLRTLFSTAEGEDYTIGYAAFAEGQTTKASGDTSHAEGSDTVASGQQSHAEGNATTASGPGSHSEGDSTTASGVSSHAEGSVTTASGMMAHSEGYQTVASGHHSHAEGRGTIASASTQHAQGRYNVKDSKYAHIVGNGTSDTDRSNAHTIDWNGNGWFAGDVYTGGTGQDEGKKLATEEYVQDAIENAEGVYELIETITLEETVDNVARTDISLADVWVEVITQNPENKMSIAKYAYTNEGSLPIGYRSDVHETGDIVRISAIGVTQHCKKWFGFSRSVSTQGGSGALSNDWRNRDYLVKAGERINRVVISETSGVGLEVGTIIKIYGVRADA